MSGRGRGTRPSPSVNDVAAPAASSASLALSRLLAEVRAAVDARLPALLAGRRAPPRSQATALPSATREALLSPGKRVRPALVVLAGELFEAPRPRLIDAGCAIEMVHAASLVLDDLPSMDDATLRRGRPALHVAHGEANAILAAVTLLARAFGLLAEAGLHARRGGIPGSAALDLVSRLADASGLLGTRLGAGARSRDGRGRRDVRPSRDDSRAQDGRPLRGVGRVRRRARRRPREGARRRSLLRAQRRPRVPDRGRPPRGASATPPRPASPRAARPRPRSCGTSARRAPARSSPS